MGVPTKSSPGVHLKSSTQECVCIFHTAAMMLGARKWELYSCCPVRNRSKDSVSGQETGEQSCTPCQIARPWLPVQSGEKKVILVPKSGTWRSQSCLLDASWLLLTRSLNHSLHIDPRCHCRGGSYIGKPQCGCTESESVRRPFCGFKVQVVFATHLWPLMKSSLFLQCYHKNLTSPVAERIQMMNCLDWFMLLGSPGYPSPWTVCLESNCRTGAWEDIQLLNKDPLHANSNILLLLKEDVNMEVRQNLYFFAFWGSFFLWLLLLV